MNGSSQMVTCYNKGCGQQFDLNNNSPDSCQFHPGVPVFHDALKGWSCCNKKSTDFTQFLSYPGCTKAAHSNIKPVEPVKSPEPAPVIAAPQVIDRKPVEMTPRPTQNELLVDLKRTVASNLTATLLKLSEASKEVEKSENGSTVIPIGTHCKNASCKDQYENESSLTAKCMHHPGVAVFHEGMKYWSCCQRKTSDFDNFLNQEGCAVGTHCWFKDSSSNNEQTDCRYDFHQTGGFYIVTFYAKNSVPEKTSVKANKIRLEVDINFEAGTKSFRKQTDLFGVINVEESVVNFFQTKVEIKLKKADAINWRSLEYSTPVA